ncbi:MAG: hypothetical protein NTW29_21945 [Bacteroidetes bacterium]|nr:hypothetical protein [Bacteroidota bacterium]
MDKKWVKQNGSRYAFSVEGQERGVMEIQRNTMSGKALCTLDGRSFTIQRTGFWKSSIEVTDDSGNLLLKVSPVKWYASSWEVKSHDKTYQLKVRNNPLAEYVLIDSGKDILAYGLASTKEGLRLRVSDSGSHDLMFDFLLWYLFIPVADENFAGDYLFLLMAVA